MIETNFIPAECFFLFQYNCQITLKGILQRTLDFCWVLIWFTIFWLYIAANSIAFNGVIQFNPIQWKTIPILVLVSNM